MTRAERAAEHVRKAKAHLVEEDQRAKARRAAQRQEVMQAQAVVREETRKATNKRRYRVGALADEAGLLLWSDADLMAVFTVLTRLLTLPNPAAVLDAVLGEEGVVAGSALGIS
jgi:hypothetical protein